MPVSASLERWLLRDADPSVRFRALTEVFGRTPNDREVVRSRQQIGKDGWAARLLAEQHPAGQWDTVGTSGRDLYVPKYIATNWRLQVLADLGVSGRHPKVRKALDLWVRRWGGTSASGAFGGRDSEVCITGNAARVLLQFGRTDAPEVASSVSWLVRRQKADGGWHCFRSSRGTLDCWEALSAFAWLPADRRTRAVDRAIARGAEFYLSRGLLREGPTPYAPWLRFHYPRHYYYDLLVGLDVLTQLGYGDDRRLARPLDLLERRRNPDGSWNLDAWHPDADDPNYVPRTPVYPLALEMAGRPSRWITLTALAVLRRAGRL